MWIRIKTLVWNRTDGAIARFVVLDKSPAPLLTRCLYEATTPKDGSADIITPWRWLSDQQALARGVVWDRHLKQRRQKRRRAA